ncbi:MAG: sugar-transfer associated ATP-grasp domain-containing protein, partial [Mariprofundales bacterium]
WWLFFSWLQIFNCLMFRSKKLRESQGISFTSQLRRLLFLALAHGIPPQFYYRYSLWREPYFCCFSYIYTHELPQWHLTFSPKISDSSNQLISHKHLFAKTLTKKTIAAVETILFITADEEIDESLLFSQSNLFIKPEAGSQGRDCFTLRWHAESTSYKFSLNPALQSKKEILQAIQNLTSTEDFLIQPLLQNHTDISLLCATKKLVTLRLITGLINGYANAIFAVLEVPTEKDNSFFLMALDVTTGMLSYAGEEPNVESYKNFIQKTQGKTLPLWQQAVDICTTAHALFPDITTIGWDVIFTNEGVKLLEGNINWGVASHQHTMGIPTLETKLKQVLESQLEKLSI